MIEIWSLLADWVPAAVRPWAFANFLLMIGVVFLWRRMVHLGDSRYADYRQMIESLSSQSSSNRDVSKALERMADRLHDLEREVRR